jgi:Tol biopolymer transport system component
MKAKLTGGFMSLIGKTLGHYTVSTLIGKGGMGEVYRAKDQKLGRDVAIKVLPEEFAKDADRVARFQREAKLLASLNHPNIAAIHGLEESDGTHFLVLELIEGDTLADRLKRGAIPVEDALKLALQIAEALEAAHEKGVIHRDLKPANIKVTPDGKVKVLDFGLAKAFAGDSEDMNLSNSPTLSAAATQQGVILGTAAYMSPEQAKGKTVDKKTDIWAFGVVLYEMLTGRSLFAGENVSQTLARVLERQPDFSLLPKNLNFKVAELLKRCLQKESKNRYHDIADIRLDLQDVLADPSGMLVQPVAGVEPRTRLRTMLPWIAVTAILGAIVAGVAVWKLKPPEPRQVVCFDCELPGSQQFSNIRFPVLAVSPDGKQIVYSTPKGLYLRSVDKLTAKLIAGTEGDTQQPFFSPDGKWIGYCSVADKKLKKIAVNGGAPVALCDVTSPLGASWGSDDTIVYAQFGRDIMRISAKGGTPESLITFQSRNLFFPQILPDGKSVLYAAAAGTGASQQSVMVQSLKSGEPKELFGGNCARYMSTGHIVYAAGHDLLAVPFDPVRLEAPGEPVFICRDVYQILAPQYALSDSGTLAYVPSTTDEATSGTLVWVERDGKEEPLAAPPNAYAYPKISPDGTRVAVTIRGANTDIWIWDLIRKTMTPLTFDGNNVRSIWTPDGKRIVHSSSRGTEFCSVWRKAADGTGVDEKLSSAPDRWLLPWSWSSDGRTLAMEGRFGALGSIDVLSMEGDHARKPLLYQEKHSETEPGISHDGRWMAYTSDESGKNEVYVRPFPEVDKGKWQVSTSGGAHPLWSPDGRELFFLSEENSAMVVAVETKPVFNPGVPRTLFRRENIYLGSVTGIWDIHPDGKRFLMMKEAADTGKPSAETPRKINIALNWFEELKERVAVE